MSTMNQTTACTRRSFVAGASVAAAGAVAAGALQAAAPNAAHAEETAGRWSWSVAPAPVADDQISETIECDVLVCGYGSGGVPAAVYAAAMGASTVVMTAGSMPEAVGQECAVYNSPLDEEYGCTYDGSYWKKRLVMEGLGAIDMPATGVVFDRSGDALNWLAEYMSDIMPYNISAERLSDGVNDEAHDNSVEHGHLSYYWVDPNVEDDTSARYSGFPMFLNACDQRFQELGGRVLFSTPLEQLVQDENGKVVGALGKTEDGSYVKVLASKGVLLATGDFHQDPEMLECFVPDMLGYVFSRNPFGNARGGGHKAAYWAGASLAPAGNYKLGLCLPHNHESGAFFAPSAWSNIPFLRVNINGERYTCEMIAKHGTYGTAPASLADMRQPDHCGYQILDSNNGELVSAEDLAKQAEKDNVYVADTLEDLAAQVGIDVDGLLATVERYNELCEKGYDEDCGVDAEYLADTSVKEPPFYCLVRPAYAQNVAGGLTTNRYQQVLDADRHPIEGLYAAGLIKSGWCAHYYGRAGFSGTSKMSGMAGGMICVKRMLGTWDEPFSA